jgi:crotonobetainyl-CoA:carnitine CoA-transferase CaiB-like acyl-CoA transferase
MSSPPLAGVRVLSLAEQLPGPYATLLLADLGADVILVERPGSGDPSRRFVGLFDSMNRNKRSVVLNLKDAADRQRFLELVDTADVVMEGFRPGVMKRLGLDADTLRQRKPDLVYVSISSFGQDGPLAAVVGHDLSIQGVAGMLKVPIGQESRASVPVLPLADIASGMFAAFGVVSALFARERGRSGSTVDVSMLDSLVSWMTLFLAPRANQQPIRDLPPLDPGYGIFHTADGRQLTLSIAGEDPMWQSLCDLIGLPQYRDLTEKQREARVLEIDPQVRQALAKWPCEPMQQELEARGIAFGPVLDDAQVLKEPQIVHRGLAVHGVGPAQQTFVKQPILFDGGNFEITRPPPALGEHNQEVLASLPSAGQGPSTAS